MDDAPNPGGWPDPQRSGVPLNPERSMEHWVRNKIWRRNPAAAPFVSWRWTLGGWHNGLAVLPAEIIAGTYDYLGPCLTPAEVAARVAEAKADGMREAAGMVRTHAAAAKKCSEEGDVIHRIRAEYLSKAFALNAAADDIAAAILAAIPEPALRARAAQEDTR